MENYINLKGQKFGMLTVIEKTEKRGHSGSIIWLCKCECGKLVEKESTRLKYMKSCGCMSIARRNDFGDRMRKHSESHTRLYGIWCGIKDRCNNPNNKRYKDYGGRGIKICDEWKNNYKEFATWAKANGYSEDFTIDRIDNNGNYDPQNCRWCTTKEQALNKRSNKLLTYCGETMTLKEWANKLDIPYGRIQTRLIRGWSVEKALSTPSKKG